MTLVTVWSEMEREMGSCVVEVTMGMKLVSPLKRMENILRSVMRRCCLGLSYLEKRMRSWLKLASQGWGTLHGRSQI